MRETRTHGSIGREPETDSRRRLNGHEAGNGGHCQVNAYGAPRRLPTLPSLRFGVVQHRSSFLARHLEVDVHMVVVPHPSWPPHEGVQIAARHPAHRARAPDQRTPAPR